MSCPMACYWLDLYSVQVGMIKILFNNYESSPDKSHLWGCYYAVDSS